jgi:transglutaminase-like putative cysteine protease
MNRLGAAWNRLPRDGRDTLFQLAVIAWTLVPHVTHLPLWCTALATLMLVWRARLAVAGGPLPGRWTVAAVLVLATGLTLWSERTLLGKEAGVTMIVVLMTLKTLELRARRDALVVFFLGFFLVLTNFLYSQSLPVALSMLLSVWGLLAALVLAHMPVGRPSLARAGALAARAALLGVPLMVLLFVLFPRLGPLWGTPQDAVGRTGLSGTLRMGGLAQVANDESIAMRVRFFGNVPPPQAMYFRGPVLGSFDGRDWTRLVPSFPGAYRLRAEFEPLGPPVRYEVTLEATRLPVLPLLEMTPDRPDAAPQIEGWPAVLTPEAQWQLERPLNERLRFEAAAWTAYRHGPRQRRPGLRDWATLPGGYNPRTLQWAAALRAEPELQNADARALAERVLQHIRSGDYTYTLEPGPYGRDAVDEFWFDRKLGFCEHFAASFVVIMRALDVPARIVTGYQGTDPLPVDGYWIVRQSNAHAWAEYWQTDIGWVRVDPTAAVAPERIDQRGRNLAPRPGFVANAFDSVSPELAASLRRFYETLNNRWNQWVLNYSRREQFDLLRGLGFQTPSWQDLANLLMLLLAAAAAGGAAWAWWDRRRQDPWQRLQRRVQRQLASLGVNVAPHHPPGERARRVRARLGARGEALARALEALETQRYANAGPPRVERRWWPRFLSAARDAGG